MKTFAEWLAFKDNGVCTGELEGDGGVWIYSIRLDGSCPSEQELRLFVANLNSLEGWVHSSESLGRDTFRGFVKKWRKAVKPDQWIAYARVDSPGSVRRIERRAGIKDPRPDIGLANLWWLPSQEPEPEPVLAED